jgi:hypothetical protein
MSVYEATYSMAHVYKSTSLFSAGPAACGKQGSRFGKIVHISSTLLRSFAYLRTILVNAALRSEASKESSETH